MMILIHRICMAFNGFGNFRNVDMVIRDKAAMLLQNRKRGVVAVKQGKKA